MNSIQQRGRYLAGRVFFRAMFSRMLLALLPVILLGACASGLEIRSDEDPSARFDQYQTWNFFDPMGIEGGYNSDIYGELFREAIEREMNTRGYRKSADPDLLVNVTFRVDDKVKMRTYTQPYMSGNYYHRPGSPYYGTGVGVGVGTGTRATKVTETSVFIDLVDNHKDRVAWQGVAVVDASDDVAQHLRDAIFTAVNQVYGLYPHRAGQR